MRTFKMYFLVILKSIMHYFLQYTLCSVLSLKNIFELRLYSLDLFILSGSCNSQPLETITPPSASLSQTLETPHTTEDSWCWSSPLQVTWEMFSKDGKNSREQTEEDEAPRVHPATEPLNRLAEAVSSVRTLEDYQIFRADTWMFNGERNMIQTWWRTLSQLKLLLTYSTPSGV